MQDEEIKKNKDHQDGGIMFWYFVIVVFFVLIAVAILARAFTTTFVKRTMWARVSEVL